MRWKNVGPSIHVHNMNPYISKKYQRLVKIVVFFIQ